MGKKNGTLVFIKARSSDNNEPKGYNIIFYNRGKYYVVKNFAFACLTFDSKKATFLYYYSCLLKW